MGSTGKPVDQKAEKEKRKLACRLLEQGIPPRAVARQCGRSYAWIYQVRKASAETKRLVPPKR